MQYQGGNLDELIPYQRLIAPSEDSRKDYAKGRAMKKKDPILAAVLGVLFPAFGYLYLGAWARLFAVLFVVLPVGRYVFGSYFVVVFWVGAVVDAYLAAKRHNQRLAAAEATKAEAGGRPTGGELP